MTMVWVGVASTFTGPIVLHAEPAGNMREAGLAFSEGARSDLAGSGSGKDWREGTGSDVDGTGCGVGRGTAGTAQ